jgi:hypothetical protein
VLNAAETSRNLYGILKGKALYSAMHGVYAQVLQDLKCVVQENTASVQTTTQGKEPEENEFREQRRHKRIPSEEAAKNLKRQCPPLA